MATFVSTSKFERWWRKAQGWFATQFASIHVDLTPVEEKLDDIEEAVENIHVDSESADNLAAFFGLPEALPTIEVATEQEVKTINDEVWDAFYGYGMVAVTLHSLIRTGAAQNSEQSQASENAQSTGYTTQDLASVIYVDPNQTWSANGFPTLYDDEGNAIDTTTNPAQGDEVFNYQIQSES